MSSLAKFMIVAGADNRPPMVDKPQYESWKSRINLYIQDDGTVRLKTFKELSYKENFQADYDLKATNVVLQGLLPDIYALVIITKLPKIYGTELSFLCKAHHYQGKNVSVSYLLPILGIKPLFKIVESPFNKFKEDKVRMLSVQVYKRMLQILQKLKVNQSILLVVLDLNPSAPVVSAAKLPILNPNEFDLWKMRIEQYFLMTDYSLWEVIINGDSVISRVAVDGVAQPVTVLTAEQKLARKNKLKACGTLLMALPDKHQLKFNSHKDAKTLMEAIEKRFRGNTKTKKVQKTLLKQKFKNFIGSSSEDLDQIHDRLQKLKTGRNLVDNRVTTMCFDMSKVECYNCHRKGHFTRECRSPKDTRRTGGAEPHRRTTPIETSTSNALVSQCDGIGSYDWSYQAEEEPANFAFTAIPSSSSSDNEENIIVLKNKVEARDNFILTLKQKLKQAETERDDLKLKFKNVQSSSKIGSQTNNKHSLGYLSSEDDCESVSLTCPSDRLSPSGGYHAVRPPITGNFMPTKPDLVFNTALLAIESDHSAFNVQ
nr:hypothetical protein [Tanacetum cinerariifolium]